MIYFILRMIRSDSQQRKGRNKQIIASVVCNLDYIETPMEGIEVMEEVCSM